MPTSWTDARRSLIGLHPREVLGAEAYQQAEPYMREALAGRQVKFDQQFLGAASIGRLTDLGRTRDRDRIHCRHRRYHRTEQAELGRHCESSEDAIVAKISNGPSPWNRGAERLYGYTRQEAVAIPPLGVIPDEQIESESEDQRGETVQRARKRSGGGKTGR